MEFDLDKLAQEAILYVPKVILALVVIFVGFILAGKLANLIAAGLRKRDVDPTVIPFVRSLVSIVVKLLVLLSAVAMFGVNVTSFVAIFSALTLAIGLALQSNMGHFASGLLLLSLRPYKVGDIVTVGGQTGKVEAIQIFHTVIATPDNQRHIVPNGKITADTITNLSGQGTRGVDLTFGIAYTDNIETARQVILDRVKSHPFVLEEPEPNVVVTALADSSVNVFVRPFVLSDNFWATKTQLTEQIKLDLEAAGITIPFPQRDVWMHADVASVPPSPVA